MHLKRFIYIYFMSMVFFFSAFILCTIYTKPAEAIKGSLTFWTWSCSQLSAVRCGYWELNLGAQQDQPVILTTKLFLVRVNATFLCTFPWSFLKCVKSNRRVNSFPQLLRIRLKIQMNSVNPVPQLMMNLLLLSSYWTNDYTKKKLIIHSVVVTFLK